MTPRLEGSHVVLEPLGLEHHEQLCAVGLDPGLWSLTASQVDTPEDLKRWIVSALEARERGEAIPFATFAKSSGRAVGSTRFGNIDHHNRRMEIGWTWLAPAWQRTAVNTEAKYLMLQWAFETMHCVRIELKTDALNVRSRAAILRLGAREEGTLRRHMLTDSGRFRDTVYFSILDSEWAGVKDRLEARLGLRPH